MTGGVAAGEGGVMNLSPHLYSALDAARRSELASDARHHHAPARRARAAAVPSPGRGRRRFARFGLAPVRHA
jgi:hypothetical protein